jgi:hypothetical protein
MASHIVPRETAMADRTAHVLRPGIGYVAAGKPAMPIKPIHDASKCEPPAPTGNDTWHWLTSPHGKDIKLQWNLAKREWAPPIGVGNRMAFDSKYLAAHGWKYKGPVAVDDK